MIEQSRPELIKNKIYDNDSIGLFVRDHCQGEIINNNVNFLFRLAKMRLRSW